MSPSICVCGLWHLGSVTAACLAGLGFQVVGLDPDADCVDGLRRAQPPIAEPGLAELVREGIDRGNLAFTTDPSMACANADVVWVTFDTPVDEQDRADVDWVTDQLERVRPSIRPNTLVLVSSQVPVGYTRTLAQRWCQTDPTLEFACSPENLRLGQAVQVFRAPDRVVVGVLEHPTRQRVEEIFGWAHAPIEWMSLESAEMTKHALNGFLAASVAYTNEVARLCEQVGADAADVERGLRSEHRIGRRAYVTPGAPIAGGTLARDVAYMQHLAAQYGLTAPVLAGILESNRLHARWAQDRVRERLVGVTDPRVALLGLTYKVGTDTLRRSSAIELARWLADNGIKVQAYDPAVHELPADLDWIDLSADMPEVLAGADIAVLGTPWPEFLALSGDQLVRAMRHAQLVDQTGFLAHLASDDRLHYVRVGRPTPTLAGGPG